MNNNRIYKSKVYYNSKGDTFILIDRKRYYLKDLFYNRDNNSIYISFSNCGGLLLTNLYFSNDDYITYRKQYLIL